MYRPHRTCPLEMEAECADLSDEVKRVFQMAGVAMCKLRLPRVRRRYPHGHRARQFYKNISYVISVSGERRQA